MEGVQMVKIMAAAGMLAGTLAAANCASPSSAQTNSYAGVYVTTPVIGRADREAQADDVVRPEASGTFIRITWDAIEPQAGRFDWSRFDAIAVPAIKAGKRLSIGIVAGTYAPAWVGDQRGAKYSMFTVEQIGCRQARIYWPWDQTYQQAYLDVMRALAAHLRAIGGYDNLAIVKNSFIAQQTLELRLPHRRAGNYKGCQIGDLEAEWAKAGYRPSRVLDGYRRVMEAMATTIFPDKIISQPTQRSRSFPNIDDRGERARRGAADRPLIDNIVATCIAVAKRRCAIQNQSLQSIGPVGDRVVAARQQGATIGWQSALFHGRSRCQIDTGQTIRHGMKRVPATTCSRDQYAALLRRGTDAGATYLELWPKDVRSYGDVIRTVDARMRSAARGS